MPEQEPHIKVVIAWCVVAIPYIFDDARLLISSCTISRWWYTRLVTVRPPLIEYSENTRVGGRALCRVERGHGGRWTVSLKGIVCPCGGS